jgi:hypothetical protein
MTSARTIGRRAVVVFASALLTGCAQSAPPVEDTQAPARGSGIVVVSFEEPSSPVVGFIDPTTGRYSQGATLNISPQSFVPADRGSVRFSPDWQRYAVTRTVDDRLHAGWVDPQSKFTDVNANAPAAGDVAFDAIGFDGMGNFYYRKTENEQTSLYQVTEGQSDGGTPVTYLPSGVDAVLRRDGTGRLADVSACPSFAAAWVSPTEYVHASGTQIYRTSIVDTPGLRDCQFATGTPLLPKDNTVPVSHPAASPDGTKVAYLRGGNELWIVDAQGVDPPTRVNVAGVDLGPAAKSMVIGWATPAAGFNRPPSFSQKPGLAGTWTGDYFAPALKGTGSAAFHVDRSDPVSGSVVTRAGDLTCNSAAKETNRTADTLSVEITLKAGADPRCRGTSTIEFAWLDQQLSGVITESSEASYVGGTLLVGRR